MQKTKRVERCVTDHPGLTAGEVAKRLKMPKAATSSAMNSLVARGLVEPMDKRKCSVSNWTAWTWFPSYSRRAA